MTDRQMRIIPSTPARAIHGAPAGKHRSAPPVADRGAEARPSRLSTAGGGFSGALRLSELKRRVDGFRAPIDGLLSRSEIRELDAIAFGALRREHRVWAAHTLRSLDSRVAPLRTSLLPTLVAYAQPNADAPTQAWKGVLGAEGVRTGDGRVIAPSALRTARYPLPLRWVAADHGGHDGAVVVGNILAMSRRSDGMIVGHGTIDLGSRDGREVARLIRGQFLTGVSFDLDAVDSSSDFTRDGDPTGGVHVTSAARVRAATLVAIPAFDEARLSLVGPPAVQHTPVPAGTGPKKRTT